MDGIMASAATGAMSSLLAKLAELLREPGRTTTSCTRA